MKYGMGDKEAARAVTRQELGPHVLRARTNTARHERSQTGEKKEEKKEV